MLQDILHDIYNKLRLQFYSQSYTNEEKGEKILTSVESFSMEAISALKRPTVAQFAQAVHISAPNAAYRVASLIKKGFLKKVRSKKDLRTFYLEPTTKYKKYVSGNESYIEDLSDRIRERFSEEDYDRFVDMLGIINTELMPGADFIAQGGNTDGSAESTDAE